MAASTRFFNPANTLTLARLPLAALIWVAPQRWKSTLGILLTAGVTDLLDGWFARHSPGGPHPAGVWLDPFCDKVFVLSSLGAVASLRRPKATTAILIASREISQAALAIIQLNRALRGKISPEEVIAGIRWKANIFGKTATLSQFAAIGALLAGLPIHRRLALIAGVVGPVAALSYFYPNLVPRRSAQPLLSHISTDSNTPSPDTLGDTLSHDRQPQQIQGQLPQGRKRIRMNSLISRIAAAQGPEPSAANSIHAIRGMRNVREALKAERYPITRSGLEMAIGDLEVELGRGSYVAVRELIEILGTLPGYNAFDSELEILRALDYARNRLRGQGLAA